MARSTQSITPPGGKIVCTDFTSPLFYWIVPGSEVASALRLRGQKFFYILTWQSKCRYGPWFLGTAESLETSAGQVELPSSMNSLVGCVFPTTFNRPSGWHLVLSHLPQCGHVAQGNPFVCSAYGYGCIFERVSIFRRSGKTNSRHLEENSYSEEIHPVKNILLYVFHSPLKLKPTSKLHWSNCRRISAHFKVL